MKKSNTCRKFTVNLFSSCFIVLRGVLRTEGIFVVKNFQSIIFSAFHTKFSDLSIRNTISVFSYRVSKICGYWNYQQPFYPSLGCLHAIYVNAK